MALLKVNEHALLLTDYKDMLKTIRTAEPQIMKDLKRNIREVAAPAQTAIKQNIPQVAPLSGMVRVHHGTKTWNFGKPAQSVDVNTRTGGKPNKQGYVTLVRLRVLSAATVIADMAGRSGRSIDKYTATKPYMYRYYKNGQAIDAPRVHRINGQGARMIDKLNERKGNASRFAWPAFEKVQDQIAARAMITIQRTMDVINGQLRKG